MSRPSVAVSMSRAQQTLLFPSLVKRLATDRRLSILEIGPALPETIKFFSQYRCRLHFAAMYTDPVLQMQRGEFTEAELADHFTQTFGFQKGTCFDLCLFWDFLNYLDDKALRAFNTAIRPYLHKTTRAHAFTVRTLDTSFPNQQYGIAEKHMFSIRPRTGNRPRTTPHTQAILVNLLSSFDIDQGMLLPDGRLEVLMTASP
ncbi:MAG: hypothetical protein GY732_14520 [Gammaproteobacteria bacterium]|nr:hypothetical protein [Gammaproteobacteria bacterium]